MGDDIKLVIFDFDETLVRGHQGTKSRSRQLNPISGDRPARNRMLDDEWVDADAFLDLVNTLTARGIEVGVASFGSPFAIEWYMLAVFNRDSPTLDGARHPFEGNIVSKFLAPYNEFIRDPSYPDRGKINEKVVMADFLRTRNGQGWSPRQVLFIDNDSGNTNAVHASGYKVAHVPDGLTRQRVEQIRDLYL